MTLTQLNLTEYRLYNICDFLVLNLPSTLNKCGVYTWYQLSDLTKDSKKVTKEGQNQEKFNIYLDSPAKYGVYCRDGCLSEYYCAAIAGSFGSKSIVVRIIFGLYIIHSSSYNYLVHY